jgi:DNA-directed RNA polymerase subunit RPC12/RpoP
MKCSKCNKEIPAGKGCYNRPDGIFCVKCNDKNPYKMKNNILESLEVAKKISGL